LPRNKPHFKVRTSIANHEKMGAVWDDNELLAAWTRLGVLAVERFADRTGDSFVISSREITMVTGRERSDSAERVLRKLADSSPVVVEKRGHSWRITIPNFAKKQGFKERNRTEIGSPPTPAPTPTATKPKESEPEAPSRLLNLLSKLPGEKDEKAAWLDHELPLIEAEVEAGSGTAKTLTIRYYRQYARTPEGERQYFDFAAKKRTRERIAVLEAQERKRAPPADVNSIPPQMTRMFE
jgi:hypothetical protein